MHTLTFPASALKSPQILELSGIGDSRVLEPLGIETIVDLPGVGANLQEHIWSSFIYGEYSYLQTHYTVGLFRGIV